MSKNEYESPLLTEIRSNYDYLDQQWQPLYDEGRIDMRYLSGDPWEPKERRAREHSDRLILTFDELNQYTNQVVNNFRQNPRSVRVVPKGFGADEVTAEKRAGMMREIEYKSKAQAAIRTAFEGAVQRSFGFYKLKTAFVSDSSWHQEIRYVRIPNPETILIDWDTKEADCSDMNYAFEFDTMPKRAYRSKWKDASYQFFNTEFTRIAPAWIKSDRVMVASYWKRHIDKDQLFLFENGETENLSVLQKQYGGKKLKVGGNYVELPTGESLIFQRKRDVEKYRVVQYVTNGVEILRENPWPGKYIPIIPVLGREIWVDEGGGAQRKLLSLVRLARSPYMAYCYLRTCQIEIAQQSPKAMFKGFKGQFDTDTDWKNIHKVPTAYVEFNLTTEQSEAAAEDQGAGGDPKLPMPDRIMFDASGIQALEISADSCRRAIQSAMNITGLLNGTDTNRSAESGEALRTLDAQESTGNFHFIDNLDLSIENGGRQINELLKPVYDGTRDVGMRSAAGEHSSETINALDPMTGNPVGFQTDQGEHDVDISTGPSAVNQAMAAADFAEQLMKQPEFAGQVMDLIIKLRNLGPLGEEMAKRFAPAEQNGIPPAVMQQLQQLQATVQQLMNERQHEAIKMQGQLAKANMDQQTQLQKQRIATLGTVATALINNGLAAQQAQLEQFLTVAMEAWDKQHEGLMLDATAARDRDMAVLEHQHSLAQQAAAPQPQPAQPGPQQ
jgi:hypothetical protein